MITKNMVIRYLILFCGLIACAFSGLNWNVGIAAWIAPVLLLFYSRNAKWSGFIFLFLGLAFCSAISKTAENVSGIFIIYLSTGLSYGLLYSLPYVIDKLLIWRGLRFYSTLVFPAAVVTIEYALSLLIGIWGNGSIAQYHNSNLIQISSVFGMFGISFLIAWFGSTVNWIVKNGAKSNRNWTGPAMYGIVFISVLLFGIVRQNSLPEEVETVKVAAIAGETDLQQIFEKWEAEIIKLSKDYNKEIPGEVFSDSADLETMIKRSEEALSRGAKIIVWNEISLLLIPSQTNSVLERVKELCMKYRAYILIAVLEKNAGDLPKPFNNKSIFVNPDGEISWEYLKHFPSPMERPIINSGSDPTPFIDTEYGRISNVICYDLDIPAHASRLGKESIDILLVPALDWEEVTPYHAHMAAFAAIQYGVNMVRANGKGLTAFYDTRGNILTQSNTFLSDAKVTYGDLPMTRTTTVYSSIGNLFVLIWIVFLLVMAVLRFSSGKKSL